METTSREFQIPANRSVDDIVAQFQSEGLEVRQGLHKYNLYMISEGEYYQVGVVNDKKVVLNHEEIKSPDLETRYERIVHHMSLMETGRKYDVSGIDGDHVRQMLALDGFTTRRVSNTGWNVYYDEHASNGKNHIEDMKYVGMFDGKNLLLVRPDDVPAATLFSFMNAYKRICQDLEEYQS